MTTNAATTPHAYGAYGSRADATGSTRTAYAGEALEPGTGWYMLGERAYSPTLRRFLAPDKASPFDGGGVNRYAYCGGDPINRIDPSGNTWRNWLGISQGLTRSEGAARSVSPASQNVNAAATTPGTTASTVAAVTDAVSITSAIDSVALMTSGSSKAAGGIFGWISMGASVASNGSGLPAARIGTPTERFGGRRHLNEDTQTLKTGTRTVQLVTDAKVPAERVKINRVGHQRIKRRWTDRTHASNRESSIMAADTVISQKDLNKVFVRLENAGVREINLYTGSHGEPYGRNWHGKTGERLGTEGQFYAQDLAYTKKLATLLDLKINNVSLIGMTKQDMQHRLSKDGVHLIGFCFGVADEAVMEALNMPRATVYDLTPPAP